MNVRGWGGSWLVAVMIASACGDDGDAPTSVSAVIGTEGGTVELVGGGKAVIPAGALDEETEITITKLNDSDVPALPDNLEPTGKPYAFKPHGITFALPVKVEVPYDGSDMDVRPVKLPNEAPERVPADWTTVAPSEKDTADNKVSGEVTSFSVIMAARPRRQSGVITLPDGAIDDGSMPNDASSTDAGTRNDASTDDASIGDDASTSDASSSDATTTIDASTDGGTTAPIQCDPYTPVDSNAFATAPVVAFTRDNGGYGVLWGVSNGAKGTIWDGTQWHPQTFAGADFYPLLVAHDGAGNTYADWGSGRATLPAGANAFGSVDTSRTPAPYGAGHNIGLIGLPTSGAMAVWSEVDMKYAQATPSVWQMGATVDARRLNEPDIAINASGDVAATWWGASTSAGQADVALALWGGTSWTLVPDHVIGAAIGGSVASVRVLMLSNGDPYVFYAQATNGDQSIHAVRYNVAGGTWSNDERLIDNANSNYEVVIDESDRITVVAVDPTTQQVRAARRIGGVWSAALDLNIGNIAALKLDPSNNPVLVVIPPPQGSPTITRVAATGTAWLAPSPTPIPVSNLLSNMVDVAFDTTNGDIIVFSASYDGQVQSLQMTACR